MSEAEQQAAVLQRVTQVLGEYEAAGVVDAREVQFLRACEDMLRKRGFVSPNMAKWMTEILLAGGPTRPSEEDASLADLLETSVPDAGTQAGFLLSAIKELRSGRKIPDWKRESAVSLHSLVVRSREMGGLTEAELSAMDQAELVLHSYPTMYKNNKPGAFRRAAEICEQYRSTGQVNRVDWETLCTAMPRMLEVSQPKYKVGDLLYCTHLKSLVLVVSTCFLNSQANIGYNVLHDGAQVFMHVDHLRKRAPKGV